MPQTPTPHFHTSAYITPPLATGIPGFRVNNSYTAFDRKMLNRFTADMYLSKSRCPGLLWDLQRGGELRVVNYSDYPVYVAMSVPGRSTSLTYLSVKRDAEDPENRLGHRDYGAVLERLPRDGKRELTDDERELANARGFVLACPDSRYRIAVGPLAETIGPQQPEYVLLVDTPTNPNLNTSDYEAGTLVPTGDVRDKLDNYVKTVQELRLCLEKHRGMILWLAYREHEAILGVPEPAIASARRIKERLGDEVSTESYYIRELTKEMGKYFDLVKLGAEHPRGLTTALCRWLADHHVLTVNDVHDVDRVLKKRDPDWRSFSYPR